MKAKILLAAVLLLLIVFFQAAYVVDETEQVIITQFGKPVGSPITDPGIGVKIPLIQKITYFPKNLLEWDGDPDEIPTNDKKYIWVDTFARWKIVDPLLFFSDREQYRASPEPTERNNKFCGPRFHRGLSTDRARTAHKPGICR